MLQEENSLKQQAIVECFKIIFKVTWITRA